MRLTWLAFVAALLLVQGACPAGAELLGTVARVSVNETTGPRNPAAASNGVDRVVVLYNGRITEPDGVYGRFFDLTGTPIGGEFQAWGYPPGTAPDYYAVGRASAGIDAGGGVVLAFEAGDPLTHPDGSCTAILAQRIDAAGAQIGSQFLVNSSTLGCQASPRVAVQPNGSFMVVWDYQTFGPGPGIFARTYDATGAPVGGEFRVGGAVNDDDVSPAIAIDGAGGYALAWVHAAGLSFHRITAAGASVTPEVAVATNTGPPAIAANPDGTVLVAWKQYSFGGRSIMARHFDATGTPTGAAFQVNTVPMNNAADEDNVAINGDPSVVALGGNRFLVLWGDQGADITAGQFDLFGVAIASPGVPERGQFQMAALSIWNDSDQVLPVGTRGSAGGALLFWEHAYPTPGNWSPFIRGTFMQRFGAACPETPLAGCRGGASAKGLLLLKKDADLRRDSMQWKWAGGTASPGEFGDPLTSTNLAVCLYDAAGQLALAATAPGASICKSDKPCWKQSGGGSTVKLKYKNALKPPLPGGIAQMTLVASAPGKASIKMKGVGLNLYSVPTLPVSQASPLRVQLVNDTTGVCFEATFTAPATTAPTDTRQFKDKND